ncbi:MAG: hypothetical protein NTY64_16710, partial [Deltaproteobacteria bacterium]|nr:hypothetical protein [Deltaproteobacteria bacterium]
SAALRFTFVAAAYHPSMPQSGGFARRVPRNAGELFTKPSLWRLFTRSSLLAPPISRISLFLPTAVLSTLTKFEHLAHF